MSLNSFWKSRRILITGASGFLGRWLVKGFHERGADVFPLVRSQPDPYLWQHSPGREISVLTGDVTDLSFLHQSLEQHDIDVVLHTAAQSLGSVARQNPIATFDANCRGTWTLLEACRLKGVSHVLMASSSLAVRVYTSGSGPPYEVSKACAELIASSYASTYEMSIATIGMPNLFGAGDMNLSRLVPDTITAVLSGKPFLLRHPAEQRDFLYIKDAVSAFATVFERLAAGHLVSPCHIQLSSGRKRSLNSVVELIRKLIHAPEVAVSGHDEAPSSSGLSDWTPAYTIEQALQETILWYQQQAMPHFAESAGRR